MIKKLKQFISSNYLLFFIIFLYVLIGILNPKYFSLISIKNILSQASIVGVVSLGLTLVIISGGIDLSVGSVMACTSVVTAMTYIYGGWPFYISLILGMAIGVISGTLAAIFILYFKLPPFISTLGLLITLSGLARFLTEDNVFSGLPDWFTKLWTGDILRIPIPVIIWVVIAIIIFIFQTYTTFGRYNYTIGSNYLASVISGVNVKKYIFIFYIISGFLASISGLLMTARLNSGQSLVGKGYELLAITAAVVGGTSLFGGIGSIRGTFYGALLISVIYTGVSFVGLSSYYQEILIGIVLVIAVYSNRIRFEYMEKL